MTLKWKDLERFMETLASEGYKKQITNALLNRYVAREFGISDYVRRNVISALHELGFIRPSTLYGNIWELAYFITPDEKERAAKAETKTEEKEIDDMIDEAA